MVKNKNKRKKRIREICFQDSNPWILYFKMNFMVNRFFFLLNLVSRVLDEKPYKSLLFKIIRIIRTFPKNAQESKSWVKIWNFQFQKILDFHWRVFSVKKNLAGFFKISFKQSFVVKGKKKKFYDKLLYFSWRFEPTKLFFSQLHRNSFNSYFLPKKIRSC
jgi:hypothetical protein